METDKKWSSLNDEQRAAVEQGRKDYQKQVINKLNKMKQLTRAINRSSRYNYKRILQLKALKNCKQIINKY